MALFRVQAPHVLYFRLETRDASQLNILANPLSIDLTLFQPDGTALPSLSLSPVSIGVWALNWPLPDTAPVGSWTSYLTITDPVGPSLHRAISFDVLPASAPAETTT